MRNILPAFLPGSCLKASAVSQVILLVESNCFYSLDSVSSIVDKSLLVRINTVYPIHTFIDGGPSE